MKFEITKLESSTKDFDPKLERTSVSFPAIQYSLYFPTSQQHFQLRKNFPTFQTSRSFQFPLPTEKAQLLSDFILRIFTVSIQPVNFIGRKLYNSGKTNSTIIVYFRCGNVRDSTVFYQ